MGSEEESTCEKNEDKDEEVYDDIADDEEGSGITTDQEIDDFDSCDLDVFVSDEEDPDVQGPTQMLAYKEVLR